MLNFLEKWLPSLRGSSRFERADPFQSIGDQESVNAQLELMRRVLDASERCNVRLFLFWGTLLGHIREGGLLPWDDDVDLAFFDPDEGYTARFKDTIHKSGLRTHEHSPSGYRTIKVFHPKGAQYTPNPWTWPYIDVYPYASIAPPDEILNAAWPVPRELILPGRPTHFEGMSCWEPELPLALLDRQYPDWRTCEKSAGWNHKLEVKIDPVASRPISTGENGRRITRS